MFRFLRRMIFVLIGFLLIAVFIWYAGPYFSFAQFTPLESELARVIAIGAVIGLWLLAALVRKLRAFRASDRLIAAVVQRPKAEPERVSPEAAKLRERFEEAVSGLKQQRRSGHSLYDLPWYVIIGAPGSGKTTALLNSGLTFPLEQRVGKGALRGVGGTRNCDWWFTDEAIFLDTAGRYTTQDSDAASDSAGWSEFLALLKKYRARRPVNGVILTISAQELLTQGEHAQEAHVEAARRRLAELTGELGIQIPVYVMVTKCDLVAGFTEFFEDLSPDGRRQVWGVTFPYEQTLANQGPEVFPQEFDALMARLNERVYTRVEDVRDVRRRTRVFAFPQQMAALRDSLTQFVNEVFSATRFDQQILLRGVYLTSGTQTGTPIDRLLAGMGRQFGIAADAIAAAPGQGKAYFVERLLKEVLIAESGLAGINRRLETRKAAAQLGSYAAMAAIAAIGVVVWSVSYSRNRAYLESAAAEVAALKKLTVPAATAPLDALRPRLDALHTLVDSSDRYRQSTPFMMRWGLYQGRAIGDAARGAYVRELDGTLLPRVAQRMRARLAESSRPAEELWIYLKAYLMLGNPERLDKDVLRQMAEIEWATPGIGAPDSRQAMSAHFQNLLNESRTLRPLALDQRLIAQVRSSIQQASIPRIIYGGVKADYAKDPRTVKLAELAGIGTDLVFRRRSGREMSEPVPALYGRAVFEEIAGRESVALLKQVEADRWVWGEGNTAFTDSARIIAEVVALYEQDYVREWDATIEDLQFRKFPSLAETAQALRRLTDATSPLRGVLRVVRDNTNLVPASAAGQPSGTIDTARKKISEGIGRIAKPVQEAIGLPTVARGSIVATHFQSVNQLVEGETGKQPIDPIIASIAQIEQQLGTLGPDLGGVASYKILADQKLRALRQTYQQQVATMPRSVQPLLAEIGDISLDTVEKTALREIQTGYEQRVQPECRRLVANRYPFASTDVEVPLDDFAKAFAPGGVFAKFFEEFLVEHIDRSADQWTLRPGAVAIPRWMIQQFAMAQKIREMFFPEGAARPAVQTVATTRIIDPETTRFIMTVDGNNVGGGRDVLSQKVVDWPGKSGAVNVAFEGQFLPDRPYSFAGPWAFFRLVDGTRIGPADPQGRVKLDIVTQFHHAEVILEPKSAAASPFVNLEWRRFSCEPS